MLETKLSLFVGSVASLPVLAQFSPTSLVGKLAVGSAQLVLSIVVVVEAYAIYRMFAMWRKDIETDREIRKGDQLRLEGIIERSATASTLLAESNKDLQGSVDRFARAVDKCPGPRV